MASIKAKGILFDMDGTLVDTTILVEKGWIAKAEQYGLDGTELIKHTHGRPCLDIFRTFFPPECHTPEYAQAYEDEHIELTEGLVAVPGIHETIAAIPPSKWAVVTAASRKWASTRISQAGLPQPLHMVSSGDVTLGKPHPEGYLKGAEALGLAASDVVVFEDAVNGVKAGLAAGAKVIGLVTSTTEENLRSAGAHFVVKDFTEIQAVDNGDHLELIIQQHN
ncbi:DL-glycerol-3-phosphatase [Coemansia erecta]|uniref:DL-glycerol-3-phosphatase n=1 Tax=Coemansia erecta TaxID=147472 RepID=A0A9W7Y584_9FUNG|nr:DL-glycerol-3-phosphatase [Coemansia erecta]